MTIIAAGYRLTAITWENDADNYQTAVLEGLTRERAAYLVDLCKVFEHEMGRDRLCNIYEPTEAQHERVMEAVKVVMNRHPDAHDAEAEPLEIDEMELPEEFYELNLGGTDFFTRVLESYKVEYVPTPIQLYDATAEFA